jgi:hypothetical protein
VKVHRYIALVACCVLAVVNGYSGREIEASVYLAAAFIILGMA